MICSWIKGKGKAATAPAGVATSSNAEFFAFKIQRVLAVCFVLAFFFVFYFISSFQITSLPSYGSSSSDLERPPQIPDSDRFTPSAASDQQIPAFVHFIWGLSSQHPFTFLQFLTFSAALRHLHPEIIYLHYVHPPTGWWWEKWKAKVERSGTSKLIMLEQRNVRSIFGNKVVHFAHKADILRLEALKYYGGIYLDTDVLVLRDFAPLYHHQVVMGTEASSSSEPEAAKGLCNAIVLSKPYSSFVARWIDSYATFNRYQWAEHSVVMPLYLARQNPLEITVLDQFTFFWPLWTDEHLKLVHDPREPFYNFTHPHHSALAHTLSSPPSSLASTVFSSSASNKQSEMEQPSYAYHLWESTSYDRYLRHYTPANVIAPHHDDVSSSSTDHLEEAQDARSNFAKLVAPLVDSQLLREWEEARADGLVDS